MRINIIIKKLGTKKYFQVYIYSSTNFQYKFYHIIITLDVITSCFKQTQITLNVDTSMNLHSNHLKMYTATP